LKELITNITPITNPIIIFAVIIVIILLTPYLSRKLKVPAIFGLIISGLIIGPHGSGIISDNLGVKILSSVGMLYLMFLAGLEINMHSFERSRYKSIVFGILTFAIPLSLGYFIIKNVFNYSFHSALLLASMFSTHTLLSYPIVNKLKITRRESVVITIGGTIITDTAVLLLLTIIVASFQGRLDWIFWVQQIFLLAAFVFLVLWGVPRISRWFFKNVQVEDSAQYLFVLVVLLLSSLLATLANIEPIVGAFLSGLALNKVIPNHSALMNRITFIGNTLFIPFFLIGVGMLINLRVLFSGLETIVFAVSLIIIALISKYLAAYLTQIIYKYSKNDRNLIFGLSASHAAATIAVILVGYNLGILSETVLNATILLILATCSVSSFVTEKAGRKIVLQEPEMPEVLKKDRESILVPVSNPESVTTLVDFALLARQHKFATIYPLSIVHDDDRLEQTLLHNKDILNQLSSQTVYSEADIKPLTRIDINIPTGISRTIKELYINKIILGWSGKSNTTNYFFGNIIENLLENCKQMMIVTKLTVPLIPARNIYVFLPANAEMELGFGDLMGTVKALSINTSAKLLLVVNNQSQQAIHNFFAKDRFYNTVKYRIFEFYPNISSIAAEILSKDLVIAVSARPSTISFNRRMVLLPKILSSHFSNQNYIIIYPEQSADVEIE